MNSVPMENFSAQAVHAALVSSTPSLNCFQASQCQSEELKMGGRHFSCCILFLLSFQYGMSYRIYILPQEGDFCLGVFTGDTCISWSEYQSARPSFVDHSTTLIFTPGNYSLSTQDKTLTMVAGTKRLTLIGDGARLQFQLSFLNIGYVSMHNLVLTNYPRIDVRYGVRSFLMENCTLIRTESQYYSPAGLYMETFNMNRVTGSTFIKVPIYAQSYRSNLVVTGSTFTDSRINGYSVTVHNSSFVNNIANNDVVMVTQNSLFVDGCVFVGNGGVQSYYGDISVMNSNFNATYGGGSAIRGQQNNIYIDNCSFSYYIGSSSIIRSYITYYRPIYQVDIRNSKFYHSNRSIYSNNNVTIMNSYFYDITTDNHGNLGGGAAVYCTKSITVTNCTFINITFFGSGRVLYAQDGITVHNSSFISSRVVGERDRPWSDGGTLSSEGDITVTNSIINGSQAVGSGGAIGSTHSVILINTNIVDSESKFASGGAIYGFSVRIINCTIQNTRAQLDGGAVYSSNDVMIINSTLSQCSVQSGKGGAIYILYDKFFNQHSFYPNVVFSGSNFSYNSATSGGVLYTNGHYNHRMEFKNSTFVFNEATDSGGVAFLGNTSLSISNCIFNNNTAGTDAGVLDVSFSSVRVKQSALSHNRADRNGGVFYGRNYTTNFTIVQTDVEHNTATNGGVFYFRSSNSNIKVIDSTLADNYATNQGGVMDIGGVNLTMDTDTIIANNLANISGNVISSCLSQITAYGLEVQPDPVYPIYCSHYSEGNSTQDSSDPVTTTEESYATTQPKIIDKNNTSTQASTTEGDNLSLNTGGMSAAVTLTSNSPLISTTIATKSHSKGTLAAHTSSSAATTVADVTRVQQWTDGATSNSDENTSTQSISMTTATTTEVSPDPGKHSWTDGPTNIPDKITTPTFQSSTANVPVTVSMSSTSTTGTEKQNTANEHLGSTTSDSEQMETGTLNELDDTVHFTETTQFIRSPVTGGTLGSASTMEQQLSVEMQADNDEYGTRTKVNRDIFQAVTLAVLCTVCIVVCVMMVVLLFIACKKRKLTLIPRGQYKKVPLTDKEQEETQNKMQEYSFMEI